MIQTTNKSMKYITQTMMKGEHVRHIGQFHWVYTLRATIWLLLLWWMLGAGIIIFTHMMIVKRSTEVAITNRRLIYKWGWVARNIYEVNIDRVEGCNVIQGVFGRIFGYGYVVVRGVGVGEMDLPPLADPIAFVKAVEDARLSQETVVRLIGDQPVNDPKSGRLRPPPEAG